MNNSHLIQRLLGDRQQNVIQEPQVLNKTNEPDKPPVDESPMVDPEILRQKLKAKLNPEPIIVEEVVQTSNRLSLELVHFASIIEFVHWYSNNKNLFSENQIKPLDTLIEARNITIGGCNCDSEKRKWIAEDYFKKFWTQNKKTDLLPTLQKILNTKKIIFGDFLSYPE